MEKDIHSYCILPCRNRKLVAIGLYYGKDYENETL